MHPRSSLVLLAAVFALLLAGCGDRSVKLLSGKIIVKGKNFAYPVRYITDADGQLVYAFIISRHVGIWETNDPTTPVKAPGVHWVNTTPDGLWIDGKQATLPTGSKVFAIRKDSSLHPVAWPRDRYSEFRQGGGFTDESLVQDVIGDALGLQKPD